MNAKLTDIVHRYEELTRRLYDPAVAADGAEFAKLMKERAALQPLADACAALTERLRGRDALPDGIQPQYDAVLAQHTRILDALAQLTP